MKNTRNYFLQFSFLFFSWYQSQGRFGLGRHRVYFFGNPSSVEVPFSAIPSSSQKSSTAVRTPYSYQKNFPTNFSNNHLNSSQRPQHQVRRPLIYLWTELRLLQASHTPPRTSSFFDDNHHASVGGVHVTEGGSPATRFHLLCRQLPTNPISILYLTFEPCNSVFQTLVYLPACVSGVFACLP